MEKRQYGESTTLETRADANESVNREKRYAQIIDILNAHDNNLGMSAKQIAVEMQKKGLIPTSERNFTAPRLTELCKKGIVEPIGKDYCNFTGKKVTYYALREV